MAGKSKNLEENSKRFRTLLQSLDTARYHADKVVDRQTDIHQARTEILSAVLFGHEVVIPAGQVADCPAVRTLLPEVLNSFERARRRVYQLSGRRYFPFRLGVERRFVEADPRGYDLFVRNYIEDTQVRIAPHIEVDGVASDTPVRQAIVMLGKAYLDRQFNDIRSVDPGYGEYMEFIFENFGENSDRTPRPVNCRDGALTTTPRDYYTRFVRNCCRTLDGRGVDPDITQPILATTKKMVRRMGEWKVDSGQRGSWYGVANEFEESWTNVRNWFDHALYQRMSRAYGIHIPSYFTQEVGPEQASREIILAYLDRQSLSQLGTDIAGGKPPLPPAAAKVNWSAIWETVAEPDVQERLRSLHLKLLDAREVLHDARRNARLLVPEEARQMVEAATATYRELTAAAVDHHIAFLNGGQSGLIFQRQNGRLLVDAQRPKSNPQNRARAEMLVDFAIETAAQVATFGLLTYPLKARDLMRGETLGQLTVRTIVDFVRRPSNQSRYAEAQFYEAERSRVNYWFTDI